MKLQEGDMYFNDFGDCIIVHAEKGETYYEVKINDAPDKGVGRALLLRDAKSFIKEYRMGDKKAGRWSLWYVEPRI
jgi:hypothetical protein